MYVADLFRIISFEDFLPIVLKRHPVFLSDSYIRAQNKEQILHRSSIDIYAVYDRFIKTDDIMTDDSIIMVVVEETDPADKDKARIDSYLVEKEDVKNDDFSLWTGENRIHQYGYNFIDWKEVLGYRLCPMSIEKIDIKNIVCEIFCEMTRFGFTEEKIKKTGAYIYRNVNGIDISNEVALSRKRNYSETKPWFSSFCDKIHISQEPKEIKKSGTQKKVITIKNEQVHIEYLKSICF